MRWHWKTFLWIFYASQDSLQGTCPMTMVSFSIVRASKSSSSTPLYVPATALHVSHCWSPLFLMYVHDRNLHCFTSRQLCKHSNKQFKFKNSWTYSPGNTNCLEIVVIHETNKTKNSSALVGSLLMKWGANTQITSKYCRVNWVPPCSPCCLHIYRYRSGCSALFLWM